MAARRDMPDLPNLEPSLRRRFRLVPNLPVMVRVSLAGISDVLPSSRPCWRLFHH